MTRSDASSNDRVETPVPVIIVNWNGRVDTMECIQSMLRSSHPHFKVYLVDNGSANNEGHILAEAFRDEEGVEVTCLEQNTGFTKANQMIIEQILDQENSYVALLNNDVLVESDWLANLITTAETQGAAVVSSRLIIEKERSLLDNAGHQMLNTGEILPIGHRHPIDRYNSSFEHVGACAAACLYSTRMIRDLGFFDEYFSTGYEDAEFGLRAYVSGYKCVFAPQAIAYHKGGQSIRKIFDAAYATMIQKSIWYTYFKLMPWPVIMAGLPFILFKMIVLILLNLIFLRFRHLRIITSAATGTVREFPIILEARNAFFSRRKARSSWQILRRQTFFLPYDLHRFARIFLKREPSALDRYGSA